MATKFLLLVFVLLHHFPQYSLASAPGTLALFLDEECGQASVINPSVNLPVDTCLVTHGALGISVETLPSCTTGEATLVLYRDTSCANQEDSNIQYNNCYFDGPVSVPAVLFACTAVAGGAAATATSTVSAGLSSIPVAADTGIATASASTAPPSSPTSSDSPQTTTKSSQAITNSSPSSTNSPQSSSNSGSGSDSNSSQPALSKNIIIAISVGGFAILVIACLLGIYVYKKRSNKTGSRPSMPDDGSSAWAASQWGGSQYAGPHKPATESWVMEDQGMRGAFSDYGDGSRGRGGY